MTLSVRLPALFAAAAFAFAGLSCAAWADDFPLAGTYTQGKPCKGDGSDPKAALVQITADKIDSQTGKCTINEREQKGNEMFLTTTCTMRSGKVLTGKLKFTLRDDKSTLDMVDQDATYKTVLNRCPANGTTTGSR